MDRHKKRKNSRREKVCTESHIVLYYVLRYYIIFQMCGSCRRTKITWGASPLFLIKIHDVQIDLEDREVSCHTCKNIILIKKLKLYFYKKTIFSLF